MAKSKREATADALKPKGWENQFGDAPAPAAKEKGKLVRKTYLMTDPLVARLDAAAKQHKIGINELVRYLCTHGLDQLETGEHTLPVRVVTTYTLDV